MNGEIDAIEYTKIIIKRKWVVFLTTVFFLGAAFIWVLLQRNTYKGEIILEIGKIEHNGIENLLESPAQIALKVKKIYPSLAAKRLNISPGSLPQIDVEYPSRTNLIIIKAKSKDKEKIRKVLEQFSDIIIKKHAKIIKLSVDNYKNQAKLYKRQILQAKKKITGLRNELKKLNKQLDELEKKALNTNISLVLLFHFQEEIKNKTQQIEALNRWIDSLGIKEEEAKALAEKTALNTTRPVSSIFISISNKSTEQLIMILITAGILGIFSGLSLVFFQEFWERNRGRI